jgi:hypothetical protein
VRVLFDQGTPVPLRRALVGHSVATAFEMGWSEMTNGDLLRAADTSFAALITTDQNLQHQQNLGRETGDGALIGAAPRTVGSLLR